MDLFQNASDDHIALMGCAVAFLLSGGLLYVSVFLRQVRHGDLSSRDSAAGQPSDSLASANSDPNSTPKKRKAA